MQIKNYPGFTILTIVILFISFAVSSQVTVVRSENRVIIDGKFYYVHIVKAGQTLYSVSKAYEVSEMDIITENPGVDAGLQVGQVLKIPAEGKPPVKKENINISIPPDTIYQHHEVIQGETMYSIAKSLGLKIDELEKVNPGIINHEIKIGQLINIPVVNLKNEADVNDFSLHKVKKRDTVFGIARMYNISEELLKKYNPELYENLPKQGQILKIPHSKNVTVVKLNTELKAKDSLMEFEVLKYDTIMIAGKYSGYLENSTEIPDASFNVAYLIPFNYRTEDELSPADENGNATDDIVNLDHESNLNDQMLSSRNFMEFMEGSLLAIDSLKNEGISVNIFVYDTKKSPDRVREILNLKEFQKMDMIIGPFYSYNVDLVSEYSSLHRIPMFSPINAESGAVENNPFYFQMNPGYKTEYDRMADYISGFSDKNIVFIHGVDSLELYKYNYLKENVLDRLSARQLTDSIFIREIVYDYTANSSLTQDLQKALSLDKLNIVVVPETDEAFVSTVITQLYFQLKTYNISVVGMPHWNTFQNVDFMYYHKLSLSYFTPYYFSYDSANVKHFLKDYRYSFYSEPVTLTKKGGSYAFLGYDLSYNILRIMNKYGKRFILHLNDTEGHEMMNDFHFIPVGTNGGFENRSLVLVNFYQNLEIRAEKYSIAVPPDEEHDPGTILNTGSPH